MDQGGTKKRRHESAANVDIISNLPDVIKDKILCCLPIKEAVRTCLVSRKWRYTWASMTELVFNEEDFALGNGNAEDVTKRFANFVDMFLSLHNGPTLKFELNARRRQRVHFLYTGGFIHRWMLMLSRNAVKEIQVTMQLPVDHKIPSSFFSCDELEYVYLQGCFFQLPPLFKGFKQLHTLRLDKVGLSENNIGKLVASCPNLENLTLSSVVCFGEISIHSTVLKTLTVDGAFNHLSLHIPNVTSARIRRQSCKDSAIIHRTGCNIDLSKFIGSLLDIENISLLGHVFEFGAHTFFPSKLPKLLDRLTEINLDMDLGILKEAQAAHCLFQNAPNLQRIKLRLTDRGHVAPTSHFWDSIDRQVGLFGNVDVVGLTNFAGSSAELGFLKLLLEEAPALRKVQIKDNGKLDNEALKHLLKMRRASKDAEIVVN